MVSIKDVARRAGVSPQTVSNCLNNPAIVKPTTRDLVTAAIAELGYTPNASARRLRTQRSNTIAIGIAPVAYSRIYDRLLHALVTEAEAHSIRVMLYKTDSKQDEIRQLDALIRGGDVDSFVLTDTSHDDPRIPWLIEHRQTFVLFGRPWGLPDMHDPQVPWVDVDGRRGIADMTRHLILHGRKRIGFIGWPGISGTGHDRWLGWRDTLLAARMARPDELEGLCAYGHGRKRIGFIGWPGISGTGHDRWLGWRDTLLAARMARPDELEGLCAYGEDRIGEGMTACMTLLDQRPDVDAIVCVSDTLATGAMMALPPECDVVVTGFDNTASAQSLEFPTVDQPLTESARQIVRIILERLDARDGARAAEAGGAAGANGTAGTTGTAETKETEETEETATRRTPESRDGLHVLLPPRIVVD